ncbi:uncharacterized protein LOC126260004 [Schistocerca nitens]|uniref:uncharacterized protein LOC126260004 n=1 Tax=Schistocerca nitens TaxID=7011 RepID=UPI002118DEAC|nr:uncharacterized protein LOC126260004 [Schistocerca nitens]XP_049813117.1 uncharacterized protein LOC126260004 [Schistocerca nitens]XP_049813118.1 uncharacterized protein LOC126260004 [Schistocerca nitens]XP_049813119.1 uncharacterized protein LOC126260004 [Schistocerca nitens]
MLILPIVDSSGTLKKKDKVMHQAITARERLAVTLSFLATGNTYKYLAYSTRIANNTLSRMIPEILTAITREFGDNAIQMPVTKDEWCATETVFSHSPRPPSYASVDDNGCQGRISDGGVFNNAFRSRVQVEKKTKLPTGMFTWRDKAMTFCIQGK